MKVTTFNNQTFNIYNASEHEISEGLKLLKPKKTYTLKDVEAAIETFKTNHNNELNTLTYESILQSTSYKMIPDYFNSLSKEEQDNLVNIRTEAIEFIKKYKKVN